MRIAPPTLLDCSVRSRWTVRAWSASNAWSTSAASAGISGRLSPASGRAAPANGKTQRAVLLAGKSLPAATKDRFYGIWLYSSPSKAKFLGFPDPQPTKDGRLGTTFELKDEAKNYTDLVVTRETAEKPTKPGTIVLRGPLAGNAEPQQPGTTTNGGE